MLCPDAVTLPFLMCPLDAPVVYVPTCPSFYRAQNDTTRYATKTNASARRSPAALEVDKSHVREELEQRKKKEKRPGRRQEL